MRALQRPSSRLLRCRRSSCADRSLDLSGASKAKLSLEVMAHLTCAASSRELRAFARELAAAAYRSARAARRPAGDAVGFRAPAGGFAHASDLTALLAAATSSALGGRAIRDAHEAVDADDGFTTLGDQGQRGASYLIPSCSSNERYFAFVVGARVRPASRCRSSRYMRSPTSNRCSVHHDVRCNDSGAITCELERNASVGAIVDLRSVRGAAVRRSLARGAPGLHFLHLNKSRGARDRSELRAEAVLAQRSGAPPKREASK